MTTTDSSTVKSATVDKFCQIAEEYNRNAEQISKLQDRNETLSAMAQRCYATAELFQFDLLAEVGALANQGKSANYANVAAAADAPPKVPHKPKSVRAFVIQAAKEAYPEPVHATDLREQLRKSGIETHDKTVGMNLYRLSRDGIVERRGQKDWYFVPESENPKDPDLGF